MEVIILCIILILLICVACWIVIRIDKEEKSDEKAWQEKRKSMWQNAFKPEFFTFNDACFDGFTNTVQDKDTIEYTDYIEI